MMNQVDIHNGVGHNSLHYVIVQTQEQMLDALSIRAIVYIEEQGVVARQAIDGNDFQATHVVGYLGDEPICAIRIRWFNGFAKLERMAMRKAYRDPHRVKSFIEFAFAHIARKGYSTVLTHASPIYARLWRKMLQFQEVTTKTPVHFGGHAEPYLELVRYLDVPEDAITSATDPTTLFRVEGTWDQPSKYEARD
jgi:predicted GNAT family N-acyltransferase